MRNKSITITLLFIFMLGGFNLMAQLPSDEPLECIITNKKMGLRDRVTKSIVIPCEYDVIMEGGKNLFNVKANGLWGVVDKSGKILIAPKFNELGTFGVDGLARAKTGDKWGFINIKGSFVIPEKYEDVVAFNKDGTCTVKMNGKWGVIDKTQKVLIDMKYDAPLFFNNGYARAYRDGLYGIVNVNGTETVPCQYKDAWSIYDNLMNVKNGDKWGFIDVHGNVVIPFKYNRTYSEFINNQIGLEDNAGSYLVCSDSRVIASFPGESIYTMRGNGDGDKETYYALRIKVAPFKKYVVNSKGERITSTNYQDVGFCYSNNMINVKMNDKWGFLNTNGTMALDYKYDDVSLVHSGKGIAVKIGDKWGMIDLAGNTIIPFEYDIIDQNYVFSKLIKNGKMGALNNNAEMMLPVKYDDISYPDSRLGYFPVKLDGKEGYADFYGNDTF